MILSVDAWSNVVPLLDTRRLGWSGLHAAFNAIARSSWLEALDVYNAAWRRGLTTPDILHWTFSGKIVFFTVLGGFQTFAGPIIGAIAFNYLEVYAVGHTVYWQLVLGVVLVTLVLVLPAGIVGSLLRWLPRRRRSAA